MWQMNIYLLNELQLEWNMEGFFVVVCLCVQRVPLSQGMDKVEGTVGGGGGGG
jgi:hypothetical protein